LLRQKREEEISQKPAGQTINAREKPTDLQEQQALKNKNKRLKTVVSQAAWHRLLQSGRD